MIYNENILNDSNDQNAEKKQASQKTGKSNFLESAIDKPNLCSEMNDNQKSTLASLVQDEFTVDLNSRSDWYERMKSALDLAMQVKKSKTFPWPNAANVKFPLLTTAAIQFNARAYPAIVPGKDIVKCKVNGDDSGIFKAKMDEQGQPLMTEEGMPDAEMVVEPGMKQKRADRVAHHMSWQLIEEMEDWEAETDRLLMILPIIGVVFRKTYFDSGKGRNCSVLILGSDLIVNYAAKSLEDAPRISQCFDLYPHQITERIRKGSYADFEYAKDASDHDKPQEFIEQHRLFDLDNDGYPEPYIVTLHKETKQIVRVVARFEKDGIEYSEDDQRKVAKITPVHYYTKYGFIPNPESGIYDLGFGTLLQPINETVNTIFNQMLDAGTIQNAGGGFIGKGLKIRSGTMSFKPGEYKRVEATGGKIAENIYTMQHNGASPTLFQLLGLLIESGKEVASVKDVLTGESQGANASPTTTVALIEQGLKTFTAIFKRIHRSLKEELKKLYVLNQKFLPEETYFTLHDEQEAVKDKDYQTGDFDIVPVSDPTVVTDMQKMSKAQLLIGFKDDPYFEPMEIRRRFLDAVGVDDIDKILREPQPQGPEPKDQLAKMKLELDAMVQKQKLPAEVAEIMSRAMANVANAEAKEVGTQLQAYQTVIESLLPEETPTNEPQQQVSDPNAGAI